MSPGLSEDEQVATLASIAGLEDLEHARRMLRQHGGNLEAAVNTAMGFTAPDPSNAVGHADPRDGGRSAPGSRPRQRVRPLRPNPRAAPQHPRRHRARHLRDRVQGHRRRARRAGGPKQRQANRARGDGRRHGRSRRSAIKFKRKDAREFGDNLPNFLECSHASALRAATDELKLLFVYLHALGAPGVPRVLPRRPLAPGRGRRGELDASFTAWGGDVRETDAHLLASRLHPSTFPYVALMTSTPGERGGTLVLAVGAVEPSDLARLLAESAEERGVELAGVRAERDARRRSDASGTSRTRRTARRSRRTRGGSARRRNGGPRRRRRRRRKEALERAAQEEAAAVAAEGGAPSIRGEATGGKVGGAGR